MNPIDPKAAFDWICRNAQRVVPIAEADQWNAAVKAVVECVDFKVAQEAIKKDQPAQAKAVANG